MLAYGEAFTSALCDARVFIAPHVLGIAIREQGGAVMAAESHLVLAGRKIGVFGKGGAGKSTVTVLLARVLRECGYEVCVLDADSTNAGLAQAMGIQKPPETLLDYFGGMIFSGGAVTCPVDDPTPLSGAVVSIRELSDRYSGLSPEGIRLFIAGKMGEKGVGSGCDGPIGKIARDFRVHEYEGTPVMLVDFKAGFEDTARGIVTGLDWAVVVVDPTPASLQMALHTKDMVEQLKAGKLPDTRHLENLLLIQIANRNYQEARMRGATFVLNRLRNKETENYLRRRLAEMGITPVEALREDAAVSRSWLWGDPLDLGKMREAGRRIVKDLEAAEATGVISRAV